MNDNNIDLSKVLEEIPVELHDSVIEDINKGFSISSILQYTPEWYTNERCIVIRWLVHQSLSHEEILFIKTECNIGAVCYKYQFTLDTDIRSLIRCQFTASTISNRILDKFISIVILLTREKIKVEQLSKFFHIVDWQIYRYVICIHEHKINEKFIDFILKNNLTSDQIAALIQLPFTAAHLERLDGILDDTIPSSSIYMIYNDVKKWKIKKKEQLYDDKGELKARYRYAGRSA